MILRPYSIRHRVAACVRFIASKARTAARQATLADVWWLVARLLLSGGLLAWLLRTAGPSTIVASLSGASPGWLALANLLTLPVLLLVSWKWQILLEAAGRQEPLPRLLRMNFVAAFYGLVLPGEETGQLAKGLILARHSDGDAVAASIVVDEILGSISIFSVGLVALALTRPFPLRGPIASGIAVLWLVFVALLLFAADRRLAIVLRDAVERLLAVIRLRRVAGWLSPFWSRLARYQRRRAALLQAGAITLMANLLTNMAAFATMRAVGAPLTYLEACWIVPAIAALVTVPATISGIGLREGANVVILGQLGVPAAQALAISLLSFALNVVWSLPGGLLQFGLGRPGKRGLPSAATKQIGREDR